MAARASFAGRFAPAGIRPRRRMSQALTCAEHCPEPRIPIFSSFSMEICCSRSCSCSCSCSYCSYYYYEIISYYNLSCTARLTPRSCDIGPNEAPAYAAALARLTALLALDIRRPSRRLRVEIEWAVRASRVSSIASPVWRTAAVQSRPFLFHIDGPPIRPHAATTPSAATAAPPWRWSLGSSPA